MSGLNSNGSQIAKTIKLYINGQFPRTESGRSFPVYVHGTEQVYANLCQSSRKDLRGAVEASQNALKGWSSRTAYNRAQILYRMAEMLEGKREEVLSLLTNVTGADEKRALKSFNDGIDTLVYYAGFADKFSQVLASVNPVSGPFHNFTSPDPVGVVGLLYDEDFSLDRFLAQIASVICSGNTVVAIFDKPGAVLTSCLGEVFATSDLPPGVVNLLSGSIDELYKHLAGHMEVQSIAYAGSDAEKLSTINELSIENMKRVVPWSKFDLLDLQPIAAFVEYKTIWHPVGL